ncbi:MAG: hypothetical protein ACFFDQ_08575 [Candidatus Thorarchaeota archaeon]
MSTYKLMRNEVRILFNQFKLAISTPSMLLFYGISFLGIYFVSYVVSSFVSFAPLFFSFGTLLEETIDREMIFAATAVISASSVVSGYFGLGPGAVLTSTDESLIMSAPIKPHQIFLSRYVRRIIRKLSFLLIGVLSVLPLLISARLLFFAVIFLLTVITIFLEINYFLGAISSYVRLKLSARVKHRFRNLIVLVLGALTLLPAHPWLLSNAIAVHIIPSNAVALLLTEFTGVFSHGFNPVHAIIFIFLD